MGDNRFSGNGAGVLCKVCGDRASGKHYGVPSCDGCRGFFKRSIRRNLEYVCKEGGKCIVDVSRRNQCQACRFAKCIAANMRREAVQHERAPKMSSSTASNYPANFYTSRYHESIFPFSMHHLATPIPFPFDNYHLPTPPYYPHLAESLNLKINQTVYRPPALTPPSNYDHEIGKILTNNLFSRVPTVECATKEGGGGDKGAKENEVTSSEEVPSSVTLKTTQSLYDSASKILFLAIRWAKSIPSFNQLPVNIQKAMLNETWGELFIVASAQWGLSFDENFITNSQHLKQLQGFIKHFLQMKIDHFEAACLKALILFRANVSESDQVISQQLILLQNQTLCLLVEKCGVMRLAHLLLMLPQIKVVGNAQHLQDNLFKHTIGDIFIEKILEDIPQI